MKWYKHDPDHFLVGTSGLTLEETGAYIKIINVLYSRDGILPDDDNSIRRMLGCHGRTWRALKSKLVSKGKIWIFETKSGPQLMAKGVQNGLKEARNYAEKSGKNRKTSTKSTKRADTSTSTSTSILRKKERDALARKTNGNGNRKSHAENRSVHAASRRVVEQVIEDIHVRLTHHGGDGKNPGPLAVRLLPKR
jgi:uncharacterized protein YdaU (DUF1376 family)